MTENIRSELLILCFKTNVLTFVPERGLEPLRDYSH